MVTKGKGQRAKAKAKAKAKGKGKTGTTLYSDLKGVDGTSFWGLGCWEAPVPKFDHKFSLRNWLKHSCQKIKVGFNMLM